MSAKRARDVGADRACGAHIGFVLFIKEYMKPRVKDIVRIHEVRGFDHCFAILNNAIYWRGNEYLERGMGQT